MSSLVVPITKISEVRPHPNADKLDIAVILGWQVIVGRHQFKHGDMVVYIPPDAMLPADLAEKFGVAKYLSKGRVRQVKLRGEPSYGFAVPCDVLRGIHEGLFGEGLNMAEVLGITKYVPPMKMTTGDQAPDRADFPKYTSIENMRNFPDVFAPGELVVVTEKVHGTNCRVGVIAGELVAGSKGTVRKPPQTPDGEPLNADELYRHHTYWFPFSLPGVRSLLDELSKSHKQVVLFGEVFGPKIQNFSYGLKGTLGFSAFDLYIDGKYVDYGTFLRHCMRHGVATTPPFSVSLPFSLDAVKKLASEKSLLCEMLGGTNISEGVVVRPLVEREDPRVGRVCLKYVSDEYLMGEDAETVDEHANSA